VELEVHHPGLDVRGVTAAGVPVMGIGHNGSIAWGFTSGLSDEDDLYAEELAGPERYRFRGEERGMECRDEVFSFSTPVTDVAGGAAPESGSVTERICRTVHGPVQVRAGNTAYARRYAIWGREVESLAGIAALNAAGSVAEVDRAMQQVTWNENVIAADSAGNIGYWHPGLHQLRPRGYDERLPYPGTGEAEWRGLRDRATDPHVINPKQGWLANWNNLPARGWTTGDAESFERLAGPFHRGQYLQRAVAALARDPSYEGAKSLLRTVGTTAQQRPLAQARLRRAAARATGTAKAVLDALLAWDGSYHRTDDAGTVDPGVAIWEELKDQLETAALQRLGGDLEAARSIAGNPGTSHQFDISNGEACALRNSTPARLRQAARGAAIALARRFETDDVTRWREPRRMYEMTAQGAAAIPELPFFDRGTWEQLVEVGP
jgi:penicillin amidase